MRKVSTSFVYSHPQLPRPPNDYQPLTFSKPRSAILSYCRAGDPGHTVDVSPVEPTVRALLGISSR